MKVHFLFFIFFIFFLGCLSNQQNTPSADLNLVPQIETNNQSNTTTNPTPIDDKYLEKKSKIIEQSFTNNSSYICENTNNYTLCYLELAIKEDNPSFCYLLDYGEDFFYCIKNWCSKTFKSSISDCEKYADADNRLICISNCIELER